MHLCLKRNAGCLGICTPAFNWKWRNYFLQKKKKVSIVVFSFSMPKGDLALYPQGFDFSCVSWMDSDSEYKNLIRNDFDTCCLKEVKEPPSLIQHCSLAAISFLSSRLFFFHPFAEQKLRKWLWKELHGATDVLHINAWKHTESSGDYKLVLSTKSVNYKKFNAQKKNKYYTDLANRYMNKTALPLK